MTSILLENVQANKLVAKNPPRDYKHAAGDFMHLYYLYNTGTIEVPKFEPCNFVMKNVTGRVSSKDYNGKPQWKFNISIDREEDLKGCANMDHALRFGIQTHKDKMQCGQFNYENPPTNYRSIYFKPSDENGNLVDGASPMFSMKIANDTTFVAKTRDANGVVKNNIFTHEELKGMNLSCMIFFSPRIFKHKGANRDMTAQPVLRCCVISEITQGQSVDHDHNEFVDDFLKNQDDNVLSDQISKLKMENTSLLSSADSSSDEITPGTSIFPKPVDVPTMESREPESANTDALNQYITPQHAVVQLQQL